ncbi:hypothetical protein Dimus_007274 [Dionaea muscipula]
MSFPPQNNHHDDNESNLDLTLSLGGIFANSNTEPYNPSVHGTKTDRTETCPKSAPELTVQEPWLGQFQWSPRQWEASTSTATGSSSPPPPAVLPARKKKRKATAPTEKDNKDPIIPRPYPWATNRRAMVLSLRELEERGMETITGQVRCNKCNVVYELEYNVKEKFREVAEFLAGNLDLFHDRAVDKWFIPPVLTCKYCGANTGEERENNVVFVRPVEATKKRSINWLFLLLGRLLGFCHLKELKYYCKHTSCHRTGAKNRLLYLTYLGLCRQLDPEGPFDD